MHKSLYIIHPFCIFMHYYSSRSKWCCCSFKPSGLILKRPRSWSVPVQLALIEFNWWASVELWWATSLSFGRFATKSPCSAFSGSGSDVRRLVRRLKAGPSAPGYLILPLRNCRSTGSRNWNTYSSRCFTITVLPYLSRVYSPKMCYRMPSRYHLVSYYAISPYTIRVVDTYLVLVW